MSGKREAGQPDSSYTYNTNGVDDAVPARRGFTVQILFILLFTSK